MAPYSTARLPALDGRRRRPLPTIPAMPTLELSSDELRDAAQAARVAAWRAQQDAAAQGNPRINASFAADADRYTRLSKKFDDIRWRENN